MKTTKEMIEVMQAYEDGTEIEYRRKNVYGLGKWGYDEPPAWDWINYDYRIKSKEKVKLYKYAFQGGGDWTETSNYYNNDDEFISCLDYHTFKRLDYTMIEVEE